MNETSTDVISTLQNEPSNNMDNNPANESSNTDKGIIQVTENTKEQHPILSKLNQIEQVQPLLKENARSLFNLEGLLDIGTSGIKVLSGIDNNSTPRSSSVSFKSNSETSSMINVRPTSLADILLLLQKYISRYMSKINEDQRRLLNRIKYVDNLALKSSQMIIITLNQSKIVSERLNEAKQVKEQAKKTRQYATSIFESLQTIEQLLDPEDRVGHSEFIKKWPALNALHERATAPNQPIQPVLLTRTNSGLHHQKSTIATTKTITNPVSFDESTTLPTIATTTTISSSTSSSSSISLSLSSSNSLQPTAVESSSSSSIVMDRLRSLVGAKKD